MTEHYKIEEGIVLTCVYTQCIPCTYYQMLFEVFRALCRIVCRAWCSRVISRVITARRDLQVQEREGGKISMFGGWEPGSTEAYVFRSFPGRAPQNLLFGTSRLYGD